MPDNASGETIAFILDIPSSKIEELKQALEGLEIKFAPENQVVAFNDAIRSQPVAMGHHIPEMVLSINWTLDEDGLTPRIPQDHKGWSTLRRQAFLQFAIRYFELSFHWNDNMINQESWPDESWEDLVKRYPMVFEEPE